MSAPKATLLSDRMAAAVSHPTRLHAMIVFWEREASPREIAAELGEPLNNVTYHVNQLRDLGWIELVAERPARGGRVMEHFYKAARNTVIQDKDLSHLESEQIHLIDMTIMRSMAKDIEQAMASGTFFAHDDNQLTRIPLDVDEQGWEETKEILDRALEDLLKVKESVLQRTAESGEETMPTKVEIIHFESPRPKRADPDAD
ncbi:MAG TPA: winged helix-turn-helix domain-containing protein [Solirubrobacterales bacterium]|nr:winged helix-turn-helix domain-containing protein [Solirubrobacterales bacterium]